MKKSLVLLFTLTTLFSCGLEQKLKKHSAPNTPSQVVSTPKVSETDLKELKDAKQNAVLQDKEYNFIMMTDKSNLEEVKQEITNLGGEITKINNEIGLIEYKTKGKNGHEQFKAFENRIEAFAIDRDIKLDDNLKKEKALDTFEDGLANDKDVFPAHVMKTTDLRDYFLEKYGIELNGENSTVAVFDTGLDIGRTDAFQDRIVYLKSLRKEDFATLTIAQEEVVDGLPFLTAEINGTKVFMERTTKLQPARTYYLGYFTEKQFKGHTDHYNNYDLNQDGKDEAVFPIIAFKNEHDIFEVYINTTYKGNYPLIGDYSIENELPLHDFNLVSEALKNDPRRYNKSNESEILSFYNFTTRLDSVKNDVIQDRHKGLINVGVTLAKGEELTDDGAELKVVSKSAQGQNLYKVGIVGLDFMGHGTHVAGIAAGNYQDNMSIFSSVANKAKIIGVAYLGGTATQSSFINTILELIGKYPNIIFNFSFGGNTLFNESQDQYGLILDKIAETYHVPFIKSAGNEGPGFNSHGVTCSERMISVSNFFATNSRKAFGTANYPDNKYYLSTSSSRGPMVDGTNKPDIGTPGWVLSALPLGKQFTEENGKNFEYWSGTSMASPNLVQVIALLYDGVQKAGLNQGVPGKPAIALDQLNTAIKNGADPYDTYPYADCVTKGTDKKACTPVIKEKRTEWWEGGAGRVNAINSFNIVEKIVKNKSHFYSTSTTSYIDGFHKKANGFLAIDYPQDKITFEIELKAGDSLKDQIRMEMVTLKIPKEINWLFFDPSYKIKEYQVAFFNKSKRAIPVYVDLSKLTTNGRINPGVHQAIIKGYNVKNPDLFEMTVPVTFVGYHSKFDNNLLGDNFKLATRGFIPAGQFVSYFIPVEKEGEAVLIDLDVNDPWPGEMIMYVYHLGLDLPKESMMATFNRASSLTEVYGHGRGHLTYVLHDVPKGLYEIALMSDRNTTFQYDGVELLGSYYNLKAEKMSLSIDSITSTESDKDMSVSLNNAFNPGTVLSIAGSYVYLQKVKKEENLTIKDKDELNIEIQVVAGMKKLHIDTKYVGMNSGTDIDLQLFDESGKVVASSMTASSDETIDFNVDKPGKYNLKILGYAIPNGTDSFKLTIEQWLSNPEIFASEFKGPSDETVLKKDFKWKQNRTYTFKATFKKPEMPRINELKDYKPTLSVGIEASFGPDQKKIVLFNKDL